uniref:E3 ubiquitin-protein ligase PPP1R11 n=1 Tax=Clastoptera arizonana TaxID=38151 RepID=A0A1B6DAN8_9HEMI
MADSIETTSTITVIEDECDFQGPHEPVRLKLKKPKSKKQVNWGEGTIDNEHLNKKKSKCCCIYNKPRAFGESSSDSSDDECENCQGHVEKKEKEQKTNFTIFFTCTRFIR